MPIKDLAIGLHLDAMQNLAAGATDVTGPNERGQMLFIVKLLPQASFSGPDNCRIRVARGHTADRCTGRL